MEIKKKRVIAWVIAGVFFLSMSSFFRSYLMMHIYSAKEKKAAEIGFEIDIPSGLKTPEKDWYPALFWYHDKGGFSNFTGEAVDLTVLYNFPAYDTPWGRSGYYDLESEYYNSFYGAYILEGKGPKNRIYGFDSNGALDFEAIARIAEYDLFHLVLPTLGFQKTQKVFEWSVSDVSHVERYAGVDGWERVDATLKTNGPAHNPAGFQRGYIQYGRPAQDATLEEDFPVGKFYTRLYIRYFESSESVVCFYVICPDAEILESVDRKILAESRISE